MVSEDEIALAYVAQAQGLRTYGSLRRCRRCGTSERYVNGLKCVACAKRHRDLRSNERARAMAGLAPTKAERLRDGWRKAHEADRLARDLAKREGRTSYPSHLICRAGHTNPERYASTGGCVACAAAASRRQYSRRK